LTAFVYFDVSGLVLVAFILSSIGERKVNLCVVLVAAAAAAEAVVDVVNFWRHCHSQISHVMLRQ